jgi:hypothetical protein
MEALIVRHVAWTCRWGRFGGSVPADPGCQPFYWSCVHLSRATQPPGVDEPICEACAYWERQKPPAGNPAAGSSLRRDDPSPDR